MREIKRVKFGSGNGPLDYFEGFIESEYDYKEFFASVAAHIFGRRISKRFRNHVYWAEYKEPTRGT